MAWVVVYRGGPQFKRPYVHQNQDVQFQSATNEARDGFVARTIRDDPTNPRAFQNLYRQQWAEDVQQQSAVNEPRDGWIPRQLPRQYQPRFNLYYWQQWAEDVQFQGATGEPRDAFPRIRPLQNPYQPRPSLYEWSDDISAPVTASESTLAPWVLRPLLQPYRARPWLYQWSEDVSASAAVTAEGGQLWHPQFVYAAYRARPSLYWGPAFDATSAPPPAAIPNLPAHWMRRLELLNLRVWG